MNSFKLKKSIRKIKWLKTNTSSSWLDLVLANPIELLIDHANCERKAAGVALQLMFRYLCEPQLAEALSPLVREELEHFERVLDILKSRGYYLKPLKAPPYGSELAKRIRREEPHRMLDSFIIAGIIEARSHERMSLLAANFKDKELGDLYKELLNSEARHFGIYWSLAEAKFPIQEVSSRLNYLASEEALILSNLHPEPRMHS